MFFSQMKTGLSIKIITDNLISKKLLNIDRNCLKKPIKKSILDKFYFKRNVFFTLFCNIPNKYKKLVMLRVKYALLGNLVNMFTVDHKNSKHADCCQCSAFRKFYRDSLY